MSTGVVVLNFDELSDMIIDAINIMIEGSMVFDAQGIIDALNKYFPQVIDLLETLVEQTKPLEGLSRIRGFMCSPPANGEETMIFVPDTNVVITGFTIASNLYKCDDTLNIKVSNNGATINLVENMYLKDCLQDKRFEVFFPLPSGMPIEMTISANNHNVKYWLDLEYVEV